MKKLILLMMVLSSCAQGWAQQIPITLADPTIFTDRGIYYLYGTAGHSGIGIPVYTSTDLVHWSGPAGVDSGYALIKGKSFGEKGFWAPQVFRKGNKYLMAYTANEEIAIAESDSPLGPFTQQKNHCVSNEGKQIDPFVFSDDDGKQYLYHVRLKEGNRIFVAAMNSATADIIPETIQPVLHGELPWENTKQTDWPVTEGPTVLKHKGKYYLIYSANDFRNIDYAVGYAVADHPLGPWEKSDDSPIIDRKRVNKNGPGHGDILQMPNGSLKYVFHVHHDSNTVSPRITAIVNIRFKTDKPYDKLVIEKKSFRMLKSVQSGSRN